MRRAWTRIGTQTTPTSWVPGVVRGARRHAVGNADGELFAVTRRCQHLGADLANGSIDHEDSLVCPCPGGEGRRSSPPGYSGGRPRGAASGRPTGRAIGQRNPSDQDKRCDSDNSVWAWRDSNPRPPPCKGDSGGRRHPQPTASAQVTLLFSCRSVTGGAGEFRRVRGVFAESVSHRHARRQGGRCSANSLSPDSILRRLPSWLHRLVVPSLRRRPTSEEQAEGRGHRGGDRCGHKRRRCRRHDGDQSPPNRPHAANATTCNADRATSSPRSAPTAD